MLKCDNRFIIIIITLFLGLILTSDEFPEDPQFRSYYIIGNFAAEYGV